MTSALATTRHHGARHLEQSSFCYEVRKLVLDGKNDAYGVCDAKDSRPHDIDVSQLSHKLPWQTLFGVIVSDLQ